MGLFDFLKKKNKGIDETHFLSNQFQNEICAFALSTLKEDNPNYTREELRGVGLNDKQIDFVLAKIKTVADANQSNGTENTDFGISDDLLNSILNREISEPEIKEYFDKLFSFAIYQIKNGRHKNALELFQKCLLIDPNADQVYSNLSILNNDMKDFDESLSNINKAINLNPSEIIYYKNKVLTCRNLGLRQEEKKCCEKIIEIDSSDLEATFSLSQINIQDSEFETALQNLNKVIDGFKNGSDEPISPQLSKIGVLYELGFVKEAEDLYRRMASFFPQEIIIHQIIPGLIFRNNGTNDTKDFFDKHYEKTKNPFILRAKADFFFDKDKSIAIVGYNEYLAINSNDVQAIQNRAILYSETNNGSNIHTEIEQILAIDPNHVNALFNKARTLASQKEYEQALKITEKIYSMDKANMNYVGLILDVLALFRSESEVENYVQELIANNPNESYNINYRKGLYYKSKEIYDKAIAIFNAQNELHVFAWNYYQIAIIKNLQGKTAESIEYLKKTFQLDPSLKKDALTYEELENLRDNSQFLNITR